MQEMTLTVEGEPTPSPYVVDTPPIVLVTVVDELVRVMVSLSPSRDQVPVAVPAYCDVPVVPPLLKLTVKAGVDL